MVKRCAMEHDKLKYQVVAERLAAIIRQRGPGAKLPSDRVLARQLKCNVLTVRKAFEAFVQSGMVIRRVGSGSFVTQKLPQGDHPLHSVTILGLVVPVIRDEYATMVLQALQRKARVKGVDIYIEYLAELDEKALSDTLNRLQFKGCSAVIIPWIPSEYLNILARVVHRSPLPVTLPVSLPGLEHCCFEQAQIFGRGTQTQTQAACELFLAEGKERIALVGPADEHDMIMQRRLMVYTRFVNEHDLPHRCALCDPSVAHMVQILKAWLRDHRSLGIFCHDDRYAVNVLNALNRLKIDIPGQVSVIGCNNSALAESSDPPLSSFQDDYEHFGHWLLQHALGAVRGELCQSEEEPPHLLIVRDSTGEWDEETIAQVSSSWRIKVQRPVAGTVMR
ncbi:MAG: GntR family transcriptional regulator [Lentisphaerae bacterium]|nr:MAG: GntR family transcriptional regulator [Lentisphaerota bacterium]